MRPDLVLLDVSVRSLGDDAGLDVAGCGGSGLAAGPQPKAAMATVATATVTIELSTMIQISFFIADCLPAPELGSKISGSAAEPPLNGGAPDRAVEAKIALWTK
jgi:hypothetical protein